VSPQEPRRVPAHLKGREKAGTQDPVIAKEERGVDLQGKKQEGEKTKILGL